MNPHDPFGVARFSKPARRAVSGYLPYVFKCQWTDRELNPDFRHARAVSSRWTISPFVFQWTAWESNPSHRPCKGQSPPTACRPAVFFKLLSPSAFILANRSAASVEGPSGSRTRSPSLPRTCAAGTPTDHVSQVIPAGIEPALSCMSRRRLRRWTTGSLSVTEVGVEPTKSPRSRRDRFACLPTRP